MEHGVYLLYVSICVKGPFPLLYKLILCYNIRYAFPVKWSLITCRMVEISNTISFCLILDVIDQKLAKSLAKRLISIPICFLVAVTYWLFWKTFYIDFINSNNSVIFDWALKSTPNKIFAREITKFCFNEGLFL